jgi:hypothetical protein
MSLGKTLQVVFPISKQEADVSYAPIGTSGLFSPGDGLYTDEDGKTYVGYGFGISIYGSGVGINTNDLDARYQLSGVANSGASGHFEIQFTATDMYQVNHNLNAYPRVAVFDNALNQVEVQVTNLSVSGLQLSFLGIITNGLVVCDTNK